MNSKLLSFTKDDIDEVINDIWEAEGVEKSNFPTPVDNPKVFVWGGPPGAGKSSSMTKVSRTYLNNNSLVISGDDYRKYHPNFKEIVKAFGDEWSLKTSDWSAAIFEEILKKALELKYNLQIEGTMRTSHLPLHTAEQLLKKGYEVNFAVVLAPKDICRSSVKERYEKQKEQKQTPRAVDSDYMNNFFKSFSKNVMDVFNSKKHQLFLVYARYDEKAPNKVFSSELGEPLTKEFVDNVLDGERVNQSGDLYSVLDVLKNSKDVKVNMKLNITDPLSKLKINENKMTKIRKQDDEPDSGMSP